jgi:hypothetical protein
MTMTLRHPAPLQLLGRRRFPAIDADVYGPLAVSASETGRARPQRPQHSDQGFRKGFSHGGSMNTAGSSGGQRRVRLPA